MSVYEIRRYGRFITNVHGDEADMFEWIRNNVMPTDGNVAIRNARTSPWRLAADARKREYKITKI